MPEERTTSSSGGQKGVKLERFDLIPVEPLRLLAEHYGKGARKYAEHQWRQGYEWSKSYSAIMRHSTAFWAGFDYDICENDPAGCAIKTPDGTVISFDYREAAYFWDEGAPQLLEYRGVRFEIEPGTVGPGTCYNHTGSHHMVAVAWHSFLLLEFGQTHPQHDDRYKRGNT